MAGRSLRIGELAAQVSLHSSALRYHEQIGLIPPPERTGGQRAYPPSTVRRIALIRMAQQVGLPLAEIRALFTGATPGTSATRHWRALAERKLPEIDAATVAQEDPLRHYARWYCDHEVTTMTTFKNVGVREFRDHATSYLSGSEPVAVSKHGRVIGFYVPLARDENDVARAIARLGETVGQVLADSGMSEDELAALVDLRATRAS